jgi:phage terminase small subunit
MGGRNAQPIDILQAKGKKHLTKNEIKQRKEAEVKFGSEKLVCPMYVYQDKVARKKWNDLIADYRKAKAEGIELIRSSDVGILAMYCKTFSEYQELLNAYQRVSEIHYDCGELDELIEDTNDEGKYIYSYKVQKALKDLFSINAILTIETAINKKMDMLIKMEDRLFLNPLAKVKNVPKKEEKKEDPLANKEFGNV